MAVTSVLIESAEGGVDDDGYRNWTVTYKVVTSDPNDGPLTVLSSTSIPQWLDAYSFGNDSDPYSRRAAYSARRMSDASRTMWQVTCQFTNRPLSANAVARAVTSDPLLQAPECSGDFIEIEEPFTTDANGFEVVNSADDPFDGLTREGGTPTLVIAQNYSSAAFPLATLTQIMNPHCTNSQIFWGLAVGVWKLSRCPWQCLRIGNGTPYYRVTYEFRAKWGGWDAKPADRGWRWYDTYNSRVRVHDDLGLPLSQPAYLNGNGLALPKGDPIVYCDGSPSYPTLGPYPRYQKYDFGLLRIPTTRAQWEAMLLSGVAPS